MITFKLLGRYGRLGNQLFQIASTIGYAKKYNQRYGFPKWTYEQYFNCNLDSDDVHIDTTLREVHELNYTELPGYFPQMGNTDLVGYFQSENYFKHCNNLIFDMFKTKETKLNSGFIHIRRGDYINLSHYHTNLPLEYYQKGMDELNLDHYYCFSDDIMWCKEHVKDPRVTFVENTTEIQDLELMMQCKGSVIANSSFSWWGAFLGNHNNVIIPKNWFGYAAREFNIEDRLCDGWKAI